MEEQDRKSESLFADDVRHSVKTVEERWGAEMKRRRRLMLRISLPIVVVLLAVAVISAWKTKSFFFAETVDYEAIAREKQAQVDAMKALEKAGVEATQGYSDAKMKILIILPEDKNFAFPASWNKLLNEAVDNNPSRIYIEVWKRAKLPPEKKLERMNYIGPEEFAIFINGKSEFEIRDELGRPKKVPTINCGGFQNPPWDLGVLLNNEFSAIYGTEAKAVDLKHYFNEEAASKKLEELRRLPDMASEQQVKEGRVSPLDNTSIVLPKFKMEAQEQK